MIIDKLVVSKDASVLIEKTLLQHVKCPTSTVHRSRINCSYPTQPPGGYFRKWRFKPPASKVKHAVFKQTWSGLGCAAYYLVTHKFSHIIS